MKRGNAWSLLFLQGSLFDASARNPFSAMSHACTQAISVSGDLGEAWQLSAAACLAAPSAPALRLAPARPPLAGGSAPPILTPALVLVPVLVLVLVPVLQSSARSPTSSPRPGTYNPPPGKGGSAVPWPRYALLHNLKIILSSWRFVGPQWVNGRREGTHCSTSSSSLLAPRALFERFPPGVAESND